MITNTSFIKSLLIVVFASTIVGCATGQHAQPVLAIERAVQEAQYTVKSGDHLADIAHKLTGDADNWDAIATYNNIENPNLLSVGDIIVIPGPLLRDFYPVTSSVSTTAAAKNNKPSSAGNLPAAAGGTLALQRPKRTTNNVADDVIVAPVVINRSFNLQPIEAGTPGKILSYDTIAPQVKVVGSYYPKGIYQQPANYSQLMMRVSPGAVLDLELEVNDWYKVKTDQGIGYIRKDDGVLISP